MPPSSTPTPTSFIPKKPLDTPVTYRESGGLGFLFFISLFIFIASAVAAGGVFGYEAYLNKSIDDKKASLQRVRDEFDPEQITQLVRLDSRISTAQTLLSSHVAPSAIFAFLSQQTLEKVQFNSFLYGLNADGSATITLTGVADSFATVALQSDQFSAATQILKDVVFSNVNNATNAVNFSVTANITPSFLNYAKNLGTAAAVTVPAVPTPAATSTQTATTTPQ